MRSLVVPVFLLAGALSTSTSALTPWLRHLSYIAPPPGALREGLPVDGWCGAPRHRASRPVGGCSLPSFSSGRCRLLPSTILHLRKMDRMRQEGDGNGKNNDEPVPQLKDVATQSTNTYKRKTRGITDAAGEVRNWLLRSELGRPDGVDERLEEIVAEFEGVEGDAVLYSDGTELSLSEARFKKPSGRDIDPSGVLARATENIEKAEALNMTYIDYVAKFRRRRRQPTVDVMFPSNRTLGAGELNLVATAHSFPVFGLLERVPWSTCWYGLFFEVEAKGRGVEVSALWTQTGIYWNDVRDKVDVWVYTKEGRARGFETSPEAWELVGEEQNCRMQRVNFTLNSNPAYGRLPLSAPLTIRAGETRAFLVTTSRDRGVVLRAAESGGFIAGQVSDEDEHLAVKTGLLPCTVDDVHDTALHAVYHPVNAAAFVGVVDYRLLPEERSDPHEG